MRFPRITLSHETTPTEILVGWDVLGQKRNPPMTYRECLEAEYRNA